ncbi:putative glucosylceramidase 4 isoform X2 [Oppia nitens]|uniref:putative glucosylceramidase 4 isoform X2 n=1 Tax=Oppia nitens TaxID=1686743 RepID=UPI0023DA0C08|nr:putative glucosylceramidase 4 isoform X2 [Oppia nitens]
MMRCFVIMKTTVCLTINILLFLSLFYTSNARPYRRLCAHRDYGNGATVCVCNKNYCDDLRPITRTPVGVIKVYETSKSGDRFAESELQFIKTAFNLTEPNSYYTSDVHININRSQTYQKIIGFGGAFTDSAGLNIRTLSNDLQRQVISDYFADTGIEYSLGRIPIGGSDFSTHPYTYDDVEGDFGLEHFALTLEDLDYKIPYIKLAQELASNEIKLYGSPWSSPAWMKTNHKINNGGFLIGEPGNKYYQTFANYFIKFLDAYTKRNVSLWGITVENEPNAGYNDKYLWNSLGFSPELQRDFIKQDLGPILAKHGYGVDKLKLMINDDQRPTVSHWARVILSDKKAAKYVSGSAFHWYESTPENVVQLDTTHNEFPDYFLLSSEACEEWKGKTEKVSLGNWHTFDRYTNDIITDLNHWTGGWTDWNLALDLQGGPNWVGNYVDAPIIINRTSNEYYKQPFFYALGHFSKFLSPDSVRIGSVTKPESVSGIQVTSFRRTDKSTALVVYNQNNESITLSINDPKFGVVNSIIKANSLQTYLWFD